MILEGEGSASTACARRNTAPPQGFGGQFGLKLNACLGAYDPLHNASADAELFGDL